MSRKIRNAVTLSGGALVASSPFIAAGKAQAATFTVDSLADDGSGGTTLREAIVAANANPDVDTITFQSGLSGTITLTSQLQITESLTIDGPGADSITVSGDDAVRVFYVKNTVTSIDVAFSGITIADGLGPGWGGGGIYSHGASISLDHIVATGNSGRFGGFVYLSNRGKEPTLTISDSTISGNTGTSGGGAIYVESSGLALSSAAPTFLVENSTFSGNQSNGGGGAIYLSDLYGPALIVNSTFTGNTADHGGALYLNRTGSSLATIANSTISGNTATYCGGALYLRDGSVDIVDAIIAGNDSTTSCAKDLYVFGTGTANISYSIVAESNGSGTINTTSVSAADPLLGALADNGGATETMLPQAGSPAIDAGDPGFTAPPSTDQRGRQRVWNGRVDIGAIEVQPDPEPPVLPPTGGSNGLMATLGAGLLALGGALHLSGRRKRSA